MLTVAIDSGPLHGPRTGIGNAVEWTLDALERVDDIELRRYVTSARVRLGPNERRLPVPAAVAHRLWSRPSRWKFDRSLGRTDVVHGTNYVVPPTTAPRVVSVYDCWFLENSDRANSGSRRVGAVLRRSVAEGATVVTSSHATSERVRELLDVEPVTIPLGPPPSIPPPEQRPDAVEPSLEQHPFVLSVGTVERRKNLPVLVDAFAKVGAEDEHVRLVIAGRDGDDAPALARAFARLDPAVRGRVHRMSTVDDATKQWLLHRATALAYPSLDEGFGFPILEAQMAGTPVVASTAGSIPEISGAGALFSHSGDVEALAANLYWSITSETQRDRLIRLGHRNVQRFSWAATASALTEVYQRVALRG